MATLAVPGNPFAFGVEIENPDELNEISESPVNPTQLEPNPNGVVKKYIVVFKERPKQDDIENVESIGEIKNQFKIIPGIAAEFKESQLEVLKNNGRVLQIYEDIKVSAFMDDSTNIINANLVQSQGVTGNGVKVCVIDSGVDDSHPALASNPLIAEIDFVNNDSNATDDYGHGTHVAGTVASQDSTFGGVSPGASLMAAKVLDQNGNGFGSDVIAGIDWCVYGPDGSLDTGDEADIITMSLGGGGSSSSCDSDSMASASNAAVDKGITVVAASGNGGSSSIISSPACGSKVIAVGAVDKFDNHASFSNRGAELDVVAPGVSITSSVPDGSCTLCHSSGWKSLQGTSMATPHVAATAALLLDANSSLTNLEIRSIIEGTSLDLGTSGWDTVFGHGRINAYDAYLSSIEGSQNNPPTTNIDSYNTQKDTPLNVAVPGVLSNDTDPDGNALTAVLDSDVTDGILSLNLDGGFVYTPEESFVGDDSFSYHAFDGTASGNTATVTITVNAPGQTGQLFFDDFESGQSNWTESGEYDWAIEPEKELNVPGHSSDNLVFHADNCDFICTITLKDSIDLSTQSSASLSFWRFVDASLDNGEYLKVQLYDGNQWNTIYNWTNKAGDDNKWHHETFDLTGYLGTADFKVRFQTHETMTIEEVEIDDVLIEGN
ncbi:MAG: S8 family serine peptidase [Nitrosopumilaceae archaeon]